MTEDLRVLDPTSSDSSTSSTSACTSTTTPAGSDVVDQCVTAAEQRVARSRVPDFKPLLIERYAREALNRRSDDGRHA